MEIPSLAPTPREADADAIFDSVGDLRLIRPEGSRDARSRGARSRDARSRDARSRDARSHDARSHDPDSSQVYNQLRLSRR